MSVEGWALGFPEAETLAGMKSSWVYVHWMVWNHEYCVSLSVRL